MNKRKANVLLYITEESFLKPEEEKCKIFENYHFEEQLFQKDTFEFYIVSDHRGNNE